MGVASTGPSLIIRSAMPVIAVDAMGGDFAPEEIVKGVAQASLATAIECVLVGDEARIQAVLDTLSYEPAHIRIHHAADAVHEGDGERLKLDEQEGVQVGEGEEDARQAGRGVSEIAFAWGFNDASHFSRAFKQRFGMSPKEYRARACSAGSTETG